MKNKKAAFKKGFFSQFLGFDSEIWLKNKFLKSCLKQKHQLHLTFKKEQWIEYNQCIISIDFITSLFQVEANIVFHTLMPHLNYVLKKIKYTIYQTLQIFLMKLGLLLKIHCMDNSGMECTSHYLDIYCKCLTSTFHIKKTSKKPCIDTKDVNRLNVWITYW